MKTMKKLGILLLLIPLLLTLASCGRASGDIPSFVWDLTENDPVLTHGDERISPASTTKLLTALYALELLPADTFITPGDEVYFPPEESSSAFIRPHHTLTLEMLIEGMLLPSGNDAAYAVAAAGGRAREDDGDLSPEDAVAAFVEGMNEYAASLGCTESHFTVPDGFAGDENYSTPADMAKIARAAAENEVIRAYAGVHTANVTYASGHTNTWVNTNAFLDPGSAWYDERVVGLKTGSLAGEYALITLYAEDGREVLVGVFGCATEDERYAVTEKRMKNVKKETE